MKRKNRSRAARTNTDAATANEPSQPGPPDGNLLATARGGGIVFIGKLFTFLSRFVVAFLLARILGAAHYGVYNLALSAATIAGSVALIGLDAALVRYIALWHSRKDTAGVWGAIQVGLTITTVLSLLTGTAVFASAYWLADQVFHDSELAPFLQLSAVIVPFLTLSDMLAGATRGFKTMHYMVLAQNFVQPLVRVILIVIFAVIGLGVGQAILIYGIADLSASVLLIYFLNKEFPLRRSLSSGRWEPREILGFAIPLWLSDSMLTFRSSIQTVLLGSLNTVTTVGIFAVASQLNLVADLVQTSVTTAVKPIIVEVHDKREIRQLERLYQTISKWIFAFNLPVFLIVVMFPTQILAVFGKSFTQGAEALTILAWASLVDAATGMCGTVIDYTGFPRLKLVNSVSRLVISIGLNLWLIPTWGMVGAAVAALVGEIVLNAARVIEVYVLFRILPYNPSSLGPVAAGCVAVGVTFLANQVLPNGHPIVHVVLQASLLLTVYVALVARLGLAEEDHIVLSHVRRRATKRFGRFVPGLG
ncbi:MAG TPA: flippase [Anaerolineae bacterium]|nr:flippase [Anaerolineae bacterium]